MNIAIAKKRSLWEYKLNFNKEQIENLVLSIWELKGVSVKYSFIRHNCASALLYLMQAANPQINASELLFYSPTDLIKTLYQNGYIEEIEILPSDSYEYRMISHNFSSKEKKMMKNFIYNGDESIFNEKNNAKKANIIKGLEAIVNYKFIGEEIDENQFETLKNKIYENTPENYSHNLNYNIKNPLQKSLSSLLSISLTSRTFNNSKSDDIINLRLYPVYNDLISNNNQYFNEFTLQLINLESEIFST